MYHANTNQRKGGVPMLISDRVDFGARKSSGIKRGHRMIKGLTLQEDIIILSVCVPNNRVSKYERQKQNCKGKKKNPML